METRGGDQDLPKAVKKIIDDEERPHDKLMGEGRAPVETSVENGRGGGGAMRPLQRRNEKTEISCLNHQIRLKIGEGGLCDLDPIFNTGRDDADPWYRR